MKSKLHLSSILLGGVFLLLDQVFKYFARTNTDYSFYILKPWLGWEFMANKGIAFSLPVPSLITIILTPFIIGGLLYYWETNNNKTKLFYLGIILIIFGALSNLIDRVAFGVTIDYLRLFYWVINLADVMVVVGAGLLIWGEMKRK